MYSTSFTPPAVEAVALKFAIANSLAPATYATVLQAAGLIAVLPLLPRSVAGPQLPSKSSVCTTPLVPVAPVAPVAPLGPMVPGVPAGPVAPVAPVAPAGPIGPTGP